MEQDEHTPRPTFENVKAKRQRMALLRLIHKRMNKEIKRVNNETD